jgi:hypothetical protein
MDPLKFQLNQHQHPSADPQLPLQVDQVPDEALQPKIEEPHIGSFIKKKPDDEIENSAPKEEENFEDLDPEEKKDYTLSIAFTLIAALTFIAGSAYYVKNYIKPSQSAPISELFIDSLDAVNGVNNADGNVLDQGTLSAADELIRKYKENLDQEKIKSASQSGTSTYTTSTLDGDTFAKPATVGGISAGTSTGGIGTNKPSINIATTTRMQNLTEPVTSKELGISFLKDPFWNQTAKGENIILKNVGPAGKDVIYMTRFRGASVITEDAMNGSVIYFYQPEQKTWMRIEYTGDLTKQRDLIPEAFAPIRATRDRKPIFDGTSRVKTLIVALGISDFIIVNISGSGYSAILDSFVSGIQALK